MGMRVLVCGGRDYDNWKRINKTMSALDKESSISLIIQGGANGADWLAAKWAKHNRKPCAQFNAHWDTLGKAAGPMRNQWMLEFGQPELIVAFGGGRGTQNMVDSATNAGIKVIRVQ